MASFGSQNAGLARNPFAPSAAGAAPAAGPLGSGLGDRGGSSDEANTGPMLGGNGSELQRLYAMPREMGHSASVNTMIVADGKVYTGGRDNNLFVWRGEAHPGVGFQLMPDTAPIQLGSSVTSLFYEPSSKWLFCGLWSGDIQAYCKDPVVEDKLMGHRRCVSSIKVHSHVVVSGSMDGTVRLFTMNPQSGRFQCHGQPLSCPAGPVTSVQVLGDGLWAAGQTGISCFDLGTLQVRGTIQSAHQVTGLLDCQGYMAATFRNGDVKIYDAHGQEAYSHPSRGEHTSNTAVELMVHPRENKPMLLCGQTLGYVTAYDLPDFRPRGSFVCKQNSDVKTIVDTKSDGIFMTGGAHGDVTVWQWGSPGQRPAAAQSATPNPFAPPSAAGGAPVAANPFAPSPAAAAAAAVPPQQLIATAAGPQCFGGGGSGGLGGDLMMA